MKVPFLLPEPDVGRVPVVRTAADLEAAFASVPAAWGSRLPDWSPTTQRTVIDAVTARSGDREIAPTDPFRALRLVSPDDVKVVILGQDPYAQPGRATGLAFESGEGRPASLNRVFTVMESDRPGWKRPDSWKLDGWARRGALLLNTVLTVEVGAGKANSHAGCEWERLVADVVRVLAERVEPPTFLLWGRAAQDFFASACPAASSAPVLKTRHPSYDHKGEFMAPPPSHFKQTERLVDWWAL